MEHAAALLMQTIFNSDVQVQAILKDRASNPQAAAEFLKPWYHAMLMMIKSAEAFDQGPTTHRQRV
jgi:hypothetical protein